MDMLLDEILVVIGAGPYIYYVLYTLISYVWLYHCVCKCVTTIIKYVFLCILGVINYLSLLALFPRLNNKDVTQDEVFFFGVVGK